MKHPDFRNWLQSRLSELNMRPVELAQKSGLSTAAISRFINGSRLPNVDTLEKISAPLNVEMADILEEAGFTNVRIPKDINKVDEAEYIFAGNIVKGKLIDSIHRKRDVKIGGDHISVLVKDNSLEHLAREGDTLMMQSTGKIKDGNFVYIKTKNHDFDFKRFYFQQNSKDFACLMPLDCDKAPMMIALKSIEVTYKITAIKLK